MKSLFNRARDIQDGVLESRMVARMDDLNRDLTDEETIEECKYLLDTIEYSGNERQTISSIKKACKYIIKAGEARYGNTNQDRS